MDLGKKIIPPPPPPKPEWTRVPGTPGLWKSPDGYLRYIPETAYEKYLATNPVVDC